MDQFKEIAEVLERHREFLEENGILSSPTKSISGFELLSLSTGPHSPSEVHQACKEVDAKIHAAQLDDPSASTKLRKTVAEVEIILSNRESASAYVDWVQSQRTPVAAPIPRPNKNYFPQLAAVVTVLVIGGLIATSVFRPGQGKTGESSSTSGQTGSTTGKTAPSTGSASTVVDPPKTPPGPTAEQMVLFDSTAKLTDAKNGMQRFDMGVKGLIPLDSTEKERSLSAAWAALEILDEVQFKPDFTANLFPAFYTNRAFAKAVLGKTFKEDIALSRRYVVALPPSNSKKVIEDTNAWLLSTLPTNGNPPKHVIWLR